VLRIGVVRTSLLENECRVSVYPEQLLWIPENIRRSMWFESSYGEDYRYNDEYFRTNTAGIASREALFAESDVLILPKLTEQDLQQMKKHQIVWGWVHCVQQFKIAQAAIDQRLTLIAWEAMHAWSAHGERSMHIFYKNNELAGYAAVHHVLQLVGSDGFYGPRRQVAVIGFGSVSRGAIYALQGRGFNNIHVYTRRPVHTVANQNPDVYYHHLDTREDGTAYIKEQWGEVRPLIDDLAKADIICNGVLQDTDHPLMFVRGCQLVQLKRRCIIIDISCDRGMGFEFARPTTFEQPTFIVGDGVLYYSVDHTPTYLWAAASREISSAMIPFLPIVAGGPDAWAKDETIKRAIEIRDGHVQNPKILSFQKRQDNYPHTTVSMYRQCIVSEPSRVLPTED